MRTNNLIFAALTYSICCNLFAGQQTGQVTQVRVRASDGLNYFELSEGHTGRPTCATHAYWMIKDETSDAGKKQLALLLSAKLSGATVTVTGSNTCTRWGDGEDANEIALVQ